MPGNYLVFPINDSELIHPSDIARQEGQGESQYEYWPAVLKPQDTINHIVNLV